MTKAIRSLCLSAALLLAAAGVHAQHFNLSGEPWQEGTPPPPPEFNANKLIEIEMPSASSIRLGVAADSISPDSRSGIVRYVVVARGPSAVNASYEGIRCVTGEYRVYARKVQDDPWREETDSSWKSVKQIGGATTRYRFDLARDGMCVGPAIRSSAVEISRELRSGNASLYR